HDRGACCQHRRVLRDVSRDARRHQDRRGRGRAGRVAGRAADHCPLRDGPRVVCRAASVAVAHAGYFASRDRDRTGRAAARHRASRRRRRSRVDGRDLGAGSVHRLMRILLANDDIAGAGGVETYLAALVPELQARGHEVGLLHESAIGSTGSTPIVGADVWRVGVRDEGLSAALARVRRFEPDVCFSHNMRTLDVDEGLLCSWPLVKMMHGHFGTCISGHKAFAFPRVSACAREFGPACLAHYLPRRCGQASPLAMVKQYGWSTRQRGLLDRYAAVVVASTFMRDEYIRGGLDGDRIAAIPLFTQLTAPPSVVER